MLMVAAELIPEWILYSVDKKSIPCYSHIALIHSHVLKFYELHEQKSPRYISNLRRSPFISTHLRLKRQLEMFKLAEIALVHFCNCDPTNDLKFLPNRFWRKMTKRVPECIHPFVKSKESRPVWKQ